MRAGTHIIVFHEAGLLCQARHRSRPLKAPPFSPQVLTWEWGGEVSILWPEKHLLPKPTRERDNKQSNMATCSLHFHLRERAASLRGS